MRYSDWQVMLLADPEHGLSRVVEQFQRHDDEVWFVDRHVFDAFEEPSFSDETRVMAGVRAGLALRRRWSDQRSALSPAVILVSEPLLVIEDEWLEGKDVGPPHLLVCLAKEPDAFRPVEYVSRPADPGESRRVGLDVLLEPGEILARAEGDPDDETTGVWLVAAPRAPVRP